MPTCVKKYDDDGDNDGDVDGVFVGVWWWAVGAYA